LSATTWKTVCRLGRKEKITGQDASGKFRPSVRETHNRNSIDEGKLGEDAKGRLLNPAGGTLRGTGVVKWESLRNSQGRRKSRWPWARDTGRG